MKYKLLLLMTCISTLPAKADAAQIYAQAIACAEDIRHCEELKKMLLGMHYFQRIATLSALNATGLNRKTPDRAVHDLSKKHIKDKGLTSQECPAHKAFKPNNAGKDPGCKEIWEKWINVVCGTEEYCNRVQKAYKNMTTTGEPDDLSSKSTNNGA